MPFCSNCGNQLSGPFCSHCGATSSGKSRVVQPSGRSTPEQTLLQDGNILVTSARFVVGGHTYAMNGVTSIAAFSDMPSRKGPVILVGLGALISLLNQNSMTLLVGCCLVALGIFWWKKIKPNFFIRLRTASGEIKALTSKDSDFIGRVVRALNDAIILRG